MDLLPDKLHQLRWKLNQKAKNEPKFRFYALYDRVCRMDVLEAAWKHVGKKGKASGIDGVRAEDILAGENGVGKFLAALHEELKTKSYRPSPVKRVYIPKADGSKVVNLHLAESLDFLGFTFRYDRDLYGSDKTYLNVMPSKKSLKKAREAIREKTGPKKCYKPTPKVVEDLNTFLRGWSNYFEYGYPRKAFRDLGHYTRKRMVTHLNRRSQRKYHRPKGMSHYQYLEELGLQRL